MTDYKELERQAKIVVSMIAEIDRLRTQNQALREALKDVRNRAVLDNVMFKVVDSALAQAEGGV